VKRIPLLVVGLWLLVSALPLLLPIAPNETDLARIARPPTLEHWLGCDELGRPVLDRLIVGARNSLAIALLVVSLSFLIGVPLGMCGALLGGIWDRAAVFLMDVVLAFPGILLAIALAGFLGPGPGNAVLALSAGGWVAFARLSRAQTLALKQLGHVEAARALGTPPPAILGRHVLPLLFSVLSVQLPYEIAGIVIAESTLSFLGLGVQPPGASLGSMILEGSRHMLVAPHIVLAPGLTILALVLSVNLLGDAARDALGGRRQGNGG